HRRTGRGGHRDRSYRRVRPLLRLSPLPPDFSAAADEAWRLVSAAPGFLTEREARFLALAAACVPAQGVILEIGSFKGKSTVGLASVAARYRLGKVVAVDPPTAPSSTDPGLGGQASAFDDCRHTLTRAGLTDPREVLRSLAGPIRGFVGEVLGSDRYGPAGCCGSIGWAQHRPVDGASARFREARGALARRAARLIPLSERGRDLRGVAKLRYKLQRALVSHGAADPETWAQLTSDV